MPRIRFTGSAEADLLELWLNIAEENPAAADKSLDSIQATVSLLATQPEMGRARPELADGYAVFRPARHTSFSMCRAKMVCWLFVCCTMPAILLRNIFHRRHPTPRILPIPPLLPAG
jgi:toxin ParE1/3/4